MVRSVFWTITPALSIMVCASNKSSSSAAALNASHTSVYIYNMLGLRMKLLTIYLVFNRERTVKTLFGFGICDHHLSCLHSEGLCPKTPLSSVWAQLLISVEDVSMTLAFESFPFSLQNTITLHTTAINQMLCNV